MPMGWEILLTNLFNPLILFFFLGIFSVLLRTKLEVPKQITQFIAIYVLMVIGLKGGSNFIDKGLNSNGIAMICAGLSLSAIVPLYSFVWLKKLTTSANAAAIGACYGSISITTFIIGASFLEQFNLDYTGYVVATLALMEGPSLLISLILYEKFGNHIEHEKKHYWDLIKRSLLQSSVFLLFGCFLIGMILGKGGMQPLHPFTEEIFEGLLLLYLLNSGIAVGKKLKKWNLQPILFVFAIVIPIINALLAIVLSYGLGFSQSDAFFLTVLSAGGSYIVAPIVMQSAILEANIAVYLPMVLTISFPFNIMLGIPLYWKCIQFIIN